jgi:YidB-like protein
MDRGAFIPQGGQVSAFSMEGDMGLLDGILGGVIGSEALSLVKDYIEKRGGIQGVVAEFEKTGFGQQAKSGVHRPQSSDQRRADPTGSWFGKGERNGRQIRHSRGQDRLSAGQAPTHCER